MFQSKAQTVLVCSRATLNSVCPTPYKEIMHCSHPITIIYSRIQTLTTGVLLDTTSGEQVARPMESREYMQCQVVVNVELHSIHMHHSILCPKQP